MSSRHEIAFDHDWPDLPVGIKNGIGARVKDRLFVGLGSAGADLYSLDLKERDRGWRQLSSFIGSPPTQPAFAVAQDKIFVFGGSGNSTPDAASPTVLDTVHSYDPNRDNWSRIETRTPVGLLGASAFTIPDGRIGIVGGYNKDQFDTYLAHLASIDKDTAPELWSNAVSDFMGRKPEEYRWNDRLLAYDPSTNTWGDLGPNPYSPNTGSTVIQTSIDRFLVVNGEIKPGLRTDEVKSLVVGDGAIKWDKVAHFPPPIGCTTQEGLAGAFGGLIDGKPIIAGGTNFPGARANAKAGRWFCHSGLTKRWASEIYILDGYGWRQIGSLPNGLAFGASFSVDAGVLVVGGEDKSGVARTEVLLIKAWRSVPGSGGLDQQYSVSALPCRIL